MKTYRVQNWPVKDDDGDIHEDGDLVELSDEKAKFYAGRLVEVEAEPESDESEYSDELPDGFPVKDLLVEAGYDTKSKVNEALDEDLLAIDGIGDSRLLDIRNYGNTGNTNGS